MTTPTATRTDIRRWCQFSMRAFFAAILLLSVSVSWIARERTKSGLARGKVRAIEESGGRVTYGESIRPAWLRSLLGNDSFAKSTEVFLSGTPINDAHLEYLEGMADLQWLSLRNTSCTGSGFSHLRGLAGLVSLDLSRTQISDQGIAQIAILPQLRLLYLDGTHITDRSLEYLANSKCLRFLDLERVPT